MYCLWLKLGGVFSAIERLSIIQEEKEEFSSRKTFDLNLNVMNDDYHLLRAV